MRFLINSVIFIILFLVGSKLQAQQAPVKVSAVVVEKKVPMRMVTGSLVNKSIARVASEEPGMVIKADFRQGDIVKKDTVLYKLDDQDLQLELALTKAELVKANSYYLQKTIESNFVEQELFRKKKAMKKTPGVISELDIVKSESELLLAKEIVNMAKAEVDLCEIRIKIINKKIEHMSIKAPFDGLLRVKSKEIGEWVNKGESVVVLVSLDNYEAHFEIPQSISLQNLVDIKNVEVFIEGAKKSYVASQFNFIAGVNEKSRNYIVAGLIKGPSLDLISGRTISTFIPLDQEKELIKINSNAIIKDPAGYFVYQAAQMGSESLVAIQAPIKVEFVEGAFHYCTSGVLKSGDNIVIEGNERLRPMAPIMIVGENK